jgi:hypothetical protein
VARSLFPRWTESDKTYTQGVPRTIDPAAMQPYDEPESSKFLLSRDTKGSQPMKRIALAALVLCLGHAFASTASAQTQTQAPAPAQTSSIEQVHVAAGSVLTFFLHARLNATDGDAVDGLPKGTLLRIKMLDSIDSAVDPDGTEFHGTVVSALTSEGTVVIHREAEVRGILALLRSRNHPEGFRYELLITTVSDQGRIYALTASLNPSFADAASSAPEKPAAKEDAKPAEQGGSKSKGSPSN